MIPDNKDTQKPRRFQLWVIYFLMLVVLSVSILFVARVASRPSEPYVSVNLVRTNMFPTEIEAISIELSNRMSFDVSCWVYTEPSDSIKPPTATMLVLTAIPAQMTSNFVAGPYGKPTLFVSYQRKLKPAELTVLNKIPWLKKHYPFNRRGSFTIHRPISDVQIRSESKQQS